MKKKWYLLGIVLIASLIMGYVYFNNENKSIKLQIKYSKKPTSKYPEIDKLKDGYLVFRRGYGVDSIVAANFSNVEKRYSHAGIILLENNKVFVIHSEESPTKHFNGIVKEKLSDFLQGVKIWAVYKYDDIDSNKLRDYTLKLKQQNITFDMDFDLKSDDKMYCSEFIYKSLNTVVNKDFIKASKIFLSKRYVVITDLYINEHTTLVDISHKILD